MAKRMLIDALHPEETRVVIADQNQIYDFDFVSASKKQLKGNIYLAKITRVEPSLQAAFVEYGGNKQGFLPFSEIHPDYYQIPVSDRKKLMEETSDDASSPQQEIAESASSESGQPESESAAIDTESSPEPEIDGSTSALPLAPAIEGFSASELEETDDRPVFANEPSTDISISEEAPQTEQPADNIQSEAISVTSGEATEPQDSPAQDAPAGEQAAESVETIPNDDEEVQERRKKHQFSRRYKIQEVIRRGQVVLVQVIKEERGNKGASLTTYLSLAGRYCVLMPNSPKDGGISRKIASAEDRKRLKAISTELRLGAGMSAIIRTAGMERTRAEIKRDYDYLVKLWNRIREDTLKSNAPALIYEEGDIIKRAIRDQYTSDIDEVIIEGDEAYESAREFMQLLLVSHSPKIKHYKEPTPLFYAYDVEDQLLSMHDEVVKLRSGGYIVINPTEALISIDVNSGRATGERNIEETAAKTNLEAAVEVARQLRLRDLAGLIVIDFIDMLESRNRRAVEKALKDALKMDRAKIQLGRISPFGLLEMSRQRLRPSISETNMVQCPHCVGRGYIRSNESMSIQMIRALEKEASSGSWSGLRLIAPQAVALHLLNTKRENLKSIEDRHNVSIQVLIDTELSTSDFNLEKMRRSSSERAQQHNANNNRRGSGGRRDRIEPSSASTMAESVLEEMSNEPLEESFEGESSVEEIASEHNSREGGNRGRRRGRRGRRGGRNRNDRGERPEQQQGESNVITGDFSENAGNVSEVSESQQSAEESRDHRSQNRNNRGRRRWRDRGGRDRNDNRNQNVATANADAPTSWKSDDMQPARSDGNTLPSFATTEPVLANPFTPAYTQEKVVVNAPPAVTSTPRDPNAPVKKGWWQKMIDLDD